MAFDIGRSLTSGELAMLQKVFGNSINYSEVRVSSTKYLATDGASFNGNVIMDANPKIYCDDYSLKGVVPELESEGIEKLGLFGSYARESAVWAAILIL